MYYADGHLILFAFNISNIDLLLFYIASYSSYCLPVVYGSDWTAEVQSSFSIF